MSGLLDAALAYARAGFPVFPVRVDKAPLTPHGFKDATTEETQIREWWSEVARRRMRMPTGALSGVVVLDVDPRHGGDESLAQLVEEHGPLPDGPVVNTGGGGRHLYFKHPGGHVPAEIDLNGGTLPAVFWTAGDRP